MPTGIGDKSALIARGILGNMLLAPAEAELLARILDSTPRPGLLPWFPPGGLPRLVPGEHSLQWWAIPQQHLPPRVVAVRRRTRHERMVAAHEAEAPIDGGSEDQLAAVTFVEPASTDDRQQSLIDALYERFPGEWTPADVVTPDDVDCRL